MNGLDLLLSYSPNSEAVHQVTLACLLNDRAIARSLGLTGTPKKTSIETNGKLFDITVEMEEGSVSHVELKINATLGNDQVERQRNFVETSQDEIIYILLGTQQFMTPAQSHLENWIGATAEREISFSDDGVIALSPKERFYESSPKRLNLDDLIDALSEASADIDQPAIRELATAYRSCLENIRETFRSFVTNPVVSWNDASWIGFYDFLRALRFSSACLDSRIGVPRFTFESHPLFCRQLAVDDFIEYHVHLDVRRGEFRFKMSVLGDYDTDNAAYVRKRFRDLLEVCADKYGLPVQWSAMRSGQEMTIGTVAVSELYKADTRAFGWEQCMTAIQSAASAISDATTAFRSSRA